MDTAAPPTLSFEDLRARVGTVLGASPWRLVDQPLIDTFADLIDDHQFIHVDPDRARDTPFGGTVAHGFLSLSVMGGLATTIAPRLDFGGISINYGFDRIRFPAPVRCGRRVRAVLALKEADRAADGTVSILYDATLQVEDEPRPAVAAVWLVRIYPERAG